MANYADSTRTPRTLTEREQRALLKVTGEHRAGYRDHVLYAMALGTGLREHELIAVSVGDVFREGRPRRRLMLSVFKGAGKAPEGSPGRIRPGYDGERGLERRVRVLFAGAVGPRVSVPEGLGAFQVLRTWPTCAQLVH